MKAPGSAARCGVHQLSDESTQHTRFGVVGVQHIGPLGDDESAQLAKRPEIAENRGRPSQGRDGYVANACALDGCHVRPGSRHADDFVSRRNECL